jgi:hypothetical protein
MHYIAAKDFALRVLLVGALLTIGSSGQASTRSPTIADWLCAGPAERAVMAGVLSLVAGQGLSEHDEDFFVRCIDEVAEDARAPDRTIGEVAAGCTMMAQLVFAEAE